MSIKLKHDDRYRGKGAEAVANWIERNNAAKFSSDAYRRYEDKTEEEFKNRARAMIAAIEEAGGNGGRK